MDAPDVRCIILVLLWQLGQSAMPNRSSGSPARRSTGPRLGSALLGAALATLVACGGGGGGGGGSPAPPPPAPVSGSCGAELNQCLAGTLVDIADSSTDHLWNCRGSNGGTTASCSLPKVIDGECGTELNQCAAGTLVDVDDSDTEYQWDCNGINGGSNAMCALPKPVDGECSEVHNQCLAGTPNDIEDTDENYLWDCGGLHGGKDTACSIAKPVFCADGAAADSNPLLCERGRYTLNGIDRLPLDKVQLTNEEMQKLFVTNDTVIGHARVVGWVACESYATRSDRCEDQSDRTSKVWYAEDDIVSETGSAPFTELVDVTQNSKVFWPIQEMESMGTVKIAIYTSGGTAAPHVIDGGAVPYAVILSAGNGLSDYPWFDELLTEEQKELVSETIAANKLLVVGGWGRDADGNYIQHSSSNNCWGVDDGCLWTRFEFQDDPWISTGTSYSAPQVASSLASVLSIFPDTAHQDLVKLARACAKKTGEGIDGADGLLAVSGGFGVADFGCMDAITAAAADLPSDGTATVTVDGHEVTVTERRLTVQPPPD